MSDPTQPSVLVTNDDGIESGFLHRLVEALHSHFAVTVAAPAFEQSWIGRAVSRHREVEVIHSPSLFPEEVTAWAVRGTPTDCVNIALGHLLDRKPDIVVSGINIGFNTTEALILSSGTVAAAIEGAMWGLPALAFSKCVPKHLYESVRESGGQTEGDYAASLAAAADHARRMTLDALAAPPPPGNVLNINFPAHTTPQTGVAATRPARVRLGSLYEETAPGRFAFRYTDGMTLEPDPDSDRSALENGRISRTLLDLSRIGRAET